MENSLNDKELIDLLDVRKILEDTKCSIDEIFECIAKRLFQEYYIKKGGNKYEFLEIEFYYYSENHEDIITYPRSIKGGKWFFHDSGVDISFASKCENTDLSSKTRKPEKDYFGGILVRSLLKNGEKLITGPQRCTWFLFDFIDAFTPLEEDLPIITRDVDRKDVIVTKTTRYIPVKIDKAQERFGDNYPNFDEYQQKAYRFYIEHPKWNDIKKSDYSARPW